MHCESAKECGGCPLIEKSRADQRAWKVERVRRLLGGLGDGIPLEFNAAGKGEGYRNRLRIQVRQDGSLGYFNPYKAACCPVLRSDLQRALDVLRQWADAGGGGLAAFSHIEVRSPDLDGRASVYLVRRDPEAHGSAPERDALAELATHFVVGSDGPKWEEKTCRIGDAADEEAQRYPLQIARACSPTSPPYQRVPLGGFMQVNFEVNAALVESVVAGAQRRDVRRCADLYCGSGNFLLPLAAAGLQGVGVESNERSIAAARRAAQEQRLDVEWVSSDVARWLAGRDAAEPAFDLALLDPPRAGIGEALPALLRLKIPHLAICSCNARSLAKDLTLLLAGGYRLESLELFDMFEQTEHVEILAWLAAIP